MIDWKIQPRARACQACEHPFADKQPYFTLLFDRKHALERLDVCATCWENQYSHGASDRKGFFSFWQGVFSAPPSAAPEPIQKESAESLLRKLLADGGQQYAAACYILAAMLERKRVLKVKAQSVQNGQRTFTYEHPKSGDILTVADPNLQLHQLEGVQRQVTRLLEHGLDAPETSPASASAPVLDNAPAAANPGSDGQNSIKTCAI